MWSAIWVYFVRGLVETRATFLLVLWIFLTDSLEMLIYSGHESIGYLYSDSSLTLQLVFSFLAVS